MLTIVSKWLRICETERSMVGRICPLYTSIDLCQPDDTRVTSRSLPVTWWSKRCTGDSVMILRSCSCRLPKNWADPSNNRINWIQLVLFLKVAMIRKKQYCSLFKQCPLNQRIFLLYYCYTESVLERDVYFFCAAEYLHWNLTVIKRFSSHLEFLRSINMEQLPSQVLENVLMFAVVVFSMAIVISYPFRSGFSTAI